MVYKDIHGGVRYDTNFIYWSVEPHVRVMVRFMGMDKSMVHVKFKVIFQLMVRFMVIVMVMVTVMVKFKFMVMVMVRVKVRVMVKFMEWVAMIPILFTPHHFGNPVQSPSESESWKDNYLWSDSWEQRESLSSSGLSETEEEWTMALSWSLSNSWSRSWISRNPFSLAWMNYPRDEDVAELIFWSSISRNYGQ